MDPVAIVGLSFRLPQGAEDVESFWSMLEAGRNVKTNWPASRINIDAFCKNGSSRLFPLKARGAHFLDGDLAVFDAPFFSITAKEAAAMDPQQRLLLETSYRALENAGISMSDVTQSQTSVFEASFLDDYSRFQSKDPDTMPQMAATGTASTILANRVSWFFNLLGPSMHIDTACSSGMIALDLACQSLRLGTSDMSLVTGANLLLGPEASIMLSRMNFLSPDSVCYSFDHRANGYARGEGVIVFVLKRLSDALRDQNMIRAIVRGTGSNQDGHTPGISQPSGSAQERLIRSVYARAGLDFRHTRYVEAHGTGTPLGDPIEAGAIGRVFRTCRSVEEPLYLGSIKSNVGHLEGVSGLAGILKAVVMLEKGVIPPNALFERPNPDLDLEFHNLKVPEKCLIWPSHGIRRISVNSFGFGGSNAHAVLDDACSYMQEHHLTGLHNTTFYPCIGTMKHTRSVDDSIVGVNGLENAEATNGDERPGTRERDNDGNGFLRHPPQIDMEPAKQLMNGANERTTAEWKSKSNLVKVLPNRLLVFTAFDESTLDRVIEDHRNYYLTNCTMVIEKLDQLAFTLSSRRSHMLWRAYALASPSTQAFKEVGFITSKPKRAGQTGLAYVFTGQGAQYSNMGIELIRYEPFRMALVRADDIFVSLGSTWSLFGKYRTTVLAIKRGSEGNNRDIAEIKREDHIHQPDYSQALCTALQLALVDLLDFFEVSPTSVLGHSSGEIAAAYACGALDFDSACKVAYYRGQLAAHLQQTADVPEAMLSANLDEHSVSEYLERSFPDPSRRPVVTVSCVNSSINVTLSGDENSIATLEARLRQENIFAQVIRTGIAYHSPTMQKIADRYIKLIGSLEMDTRKGSGVSMISSITGKPVKKESVSDPSYWAHNLVFPVRFHEALTSVITVSAKTKLKSGRTRPILDLLEIGPHGALRRPCLDIIQEQAKKDVRYTSLLHRSKSPLDTICDTLGQLFVLGYPVSIANVNSTRQSAMHTGNMFLLDTPRYPFNHSQRHWHESRMSSGYRLQGIVSGDVLGSEAPGWNPLEPKWRKVINVEDMPWVADHVVSGSPVFPASGSLIMAIEGVKEVASKDRTISGFYVKEATFLSPIVLRPSVELGESIETVLSLRPQLKDYEKEASWFETWISTYYNGLWTECFRATIKVLYDKSASQMNDELEDKLEQSAAIHAYSDAAISCKSTVPSEDFYQYCKDRGIAYGTSFQILECINWNGHDLAIGHVKIDDAVSSYGGLVHPAVIDAACQLFHAPISKGLTTEMPTEVPRRIHDAYLKAVSWKAPSTSVIKVSINCKYKEVGRGIEGSIQMLADDGTLLCKVRKMELDPIADDSLQTKNRSKLLFGLEWKPMLSKLTRQSLSSLLGKARSVTDQAMAGFHSKLDAALQQYLRLTLDEISIEDRNMAPSHMQKYIDWMERQMMNLPPMTFDRGVLEQTLTDLETERPSWRMFPIVARNVASIIRGETDPLSLIFSNSLVEEFYADIFRNLGERQEFIDFIDLASHETPQLRILEVGAGTGGFTSHVMSALHARESRTGGAAFNEYLYTDISPAFFESARTKFAQYASRMSFKPLDLERDLEEQGVEPGSYDLVIAGGVLHTTTMLKETIKNVRKALKPGGKLVMLELTKGGAYSMNFAFGILPGWWISQEEWRAKAQGIDEHVWEKMFQDNGFSGNDLILRDYEEDVSHNFSIIVTTATSETRTNCSNSRVVVVTDARHTQETLADILETSWKARGYDVLTVTWTELADTGLYDADLVVFSLETSGAFLNSLTESAFEQLKRTTQRLTKLLWVGLASIHNDAYPYQGMTDGFLRTIRSESATKQIVTLMLDSETTETTAHVSAHYIDTVFKDVFESASTEVEYAVRDQQIMIGRLVLELEANKTLRSMMESSEKQEKWGQGIPLMFDARTRGTLDSLEFIEDPIYDDSSELGPHEVEIETKAWGVNFRDMFIALGRLEENDYGFDASGIVRRVGSECEVRPGDRVVIIMRGCMRTYARTHELEVIKIPDNLSFTEVVAVAAPAVTAYRCLIDSARLRPGEKILIHSAAGATGQVAMQIAQHIGAEVFATVGTDEKKRFLIDTYNIPEDHIFYSRGTSFGQGIMRVTNNQGVHVILNSLSGEGLRVSWDLIAAYGRFIEIGKVDIKSNSGLPMARLADNVTFSAVDIAHIYTSRKDIIQQLLQDTMRLLRQGVIRHPTPVHAYPASRIEDAFRSFQTGKQIGRFVIELNSEDVVKKRTLSRSSWKFDANASYLIAGGLGGIGRAISRWMVSKGAKNLILWTRSPPTAQAALDLISELTDAGIRLAVITYDLSTQEGALMGLEECAVSMPPIKGCVNAAMVLQDSIFESMSYKKWTTALRPKVDTSWNLHKLLPGSLDFFVMLSSLSGIYGTVSQANYAAGNTFQDALARYRTHHGQKAIALNLGWMRSVGTIAENNDSHSIRGITSTMAKVETEELLALLDIYCDARCPVLDPSQSQLLVGVITPSDCQDEGVEVPDIMRKPFFSGFYKSVGEIGATPQGDRWDPSAIFRRAVTEPERTEIVIEALTIKMERALSIPANEIDAVRPLVEYGVDSLVAVELRNWISKAFVADIAVFDIMGGSTVRSIGELVAKRTKI